MDNAFATLLHRHNGFGVLEDSAEAQSVSSASGWIEPTPSITPWTPMFEVPELVISDEATPASSSILTPVEPLGDQWMSRKIQSQDLIAAAEEYWLSSIASPDHFPTPPNFYSPTVPWLPQADFSIAADPSQISFPPITPPHFASAPTTTPSWIPQADFSNPHFSSPLTTTPSWFPQADFPDPQLPATFHELGSTDTPDLNVDVGCSMPKGKAKAWQKPRMRYVPYRVDKDLEGTETKNSKSQGIFPSDTVGQEILGHDDETNDAVPQSSTKSKRKRKETPWSSNAVWSVQGGDYPLAAPQVQPQTAAAAAPRDPKKQALSLIRRHARLKNPEITFING